jgi:general secretion pathway protein A
MYYSFYGLKENAFKITPDPRFLFLSETHKEALAALVYGLEEGHTFLLLTGKVGTGKTIVLESFRANVDKNVKVIVLANPTLTSDEFYYIMARRFGIEGDSVHKARLLDRLETACDDEVKKRLHTLLIFDEAQTINRDLLEEIRLLSNISTAIIQIFFVGQPEMKERLSQPEFESLDQRIGMRCELRPMDRIETEAYIHSRLRVAGCNSYRSVYKKDALDAIFHYTRGIPRLINTLCDQVLIAGFAQNVRQIQSNVVEETIKELNADGFSQFRASERHSSPNKLIPRRRSFDARSLAAVLFISVIAIAVLLVIERIGNDVKSSIKYTTNSSPSFLPAQEKNTGIIPSDVETEAQEDLSVLDKNVEFKDGADSNQLGNAATSSIPQEPEEPNKPEQQQVPEITAENQMPPAQHASRESSKAALSPRAPVSSGVETETVTVRQGDTLARLVRNYYGQYDYNMLQKVAEYNPQITNLDLIRPGEKIKFPKLPDEKNSD